MRKRINLPITKINQLLNRGYNQTDVATILGASQSTISRIVCKGRPTPPRSDTSPHVRLCTCCGAMPVADGNRFLCSACFAYKATPVTFSEHALAT